MILESLLELVETLKARIDTHGDQLRQSEALTRYALIDPLLRELGWDTEDPDVKVSTVFPIANSRIMSFLPTASLQSSLSPKSWMTYRAGKLSIKASCTVLTQVPITSCLPMAGAMNHRVWQNHCHNQL